MAWTKLCDTIRCNPKVRAVGAQAALLYIMAMIYTREQRENGMVSKKCLRDIYFMPDERMNYSRCARRLVEQDLWIDRGDSYEIRNFLLYQPSAQEDDVARAAATARQQKRRQLLRKTHLVDAATHTANHMASDTSHAQPATSKLVEDKEYAARQPNNEACHGVTPPARHATPDPTPKPRREIPRSLAAGAEQAPPAAAAFSTSVATSSAAEAQFGSGQAPPPRASQPSASPEATQGDNGHADRGSPSSASPAATQAPRRADEPESPAEVPPAAQQAPPPAASQALVVVRPVSLAVAEEPPPHGELTTRPIAVAVPLPGSLGLVDAYEAERREWLQRRVVSVPGGVALSAGQLTLAMCQDLQLGIDVNISPRHRTLIGELAGTATAAHVQQAWVDTVTAVSEKRDTPGLGLMLKILGRVARRAVMPENCDDWVLRAANKQLTFEQEATAELRRREAADPNYYDVPVYRSQKW